MFEKNSNKISLYVPSDLPLLFRKDISFILLILPLTLPFIGYRVGPTYVATSKKSQWNVSA